MSEEKEDKDRGPPTLPSPEESVAFHLIEDAWRIKEITDEDVDLLKTRYSEQYAKFVELKLKEYQLVKLCKLTRNEILAENILLEKSQIEESENVSMIRQLEEERTELQKELDFSEQLETMAKFELKELQKVHHDLTIALENMHKENHDLVTPIITKLKDDIVNINNEIVNADNDYEKELQLKEQLLNTAKELEKVKQEKLEKLTDLHEAYKVAEHDPNRISRQISAMEKASQSMKNDLRGIDRKFKALEADAKKHVKQVQESETLKKALSEKIDNNRKVIEEREKDIAVVRSNLETAKAKNHDLVTKKLEINLRKKECESTFRHKMDQLSLLKKEYETLKRQLKKKREIADGVKQQIPVLEMNLKDQEMLKETFKTDKNFKTKELNKLKEEVDAMIANFLASENIENSRKAELEKAIAEVDECEAEVVHWMAEGKRQSKLLQVLSAQRDMITRENSRVELKEKEARQHVNMKEMIIIDMTKRCNELTNRLKEFSALYEVVKNERNKYVNLIQSSTQALAEMREKIRILNNEVEILSNESNAKDLALSKERSAHAQAQSQRDSLRQDLNRLLSEYRSRQASVEQQIQEIDKFNVVINTLERDMLEIKNKYEKAVEERNVTSVKLIDRNDELCILYERANQQRSALKKGNLELMKLDEELRLVRLQTEELKRQYTAAKHRLPEKLVLEERVNALEEKLKVESKKADDMSLQLEDPQNLERWRPLEGEDPDMEQLAAKMQVLEDRLDSKREQLLEKELVLEEVSSLTERLRSQAVAKRDGAKQLADQLNSLQCQIRDVTKKMLASVSELSMYQATALRLQQEKMIRDKTLEEAKWRLDHGEAPTTDAVKEWNRMEKRKTQRLEASMRREEEMAMVQPAGVVKTAAEPRPTAYIPDEIGIPKPYGAFQPFKPTEAGSSMRHIHNPNPKPVEI